MLVTRQTFEILSAFISIKSELAAISKQHNTVCSLNQTDVDPTS